MLVFRLGSQLRRRCRAREAYNILPFWEVAVASPHLNRRLLARQMAAQVDGLTVKMAAAALEAMLDSISQCLAEGGSVRLARFGTFLLRPRPARQTYHPRTKAPVHIPAAQVPYFAPSPELGHPRRERRGD
jgi:nucleoid DNA-binding protein